VGRFWRAEVLGSSVTPGVGGKKKKKGKGVGEDSSRRLGTLSKSDLGKMLSKALKLSFTREVEIIASTLQPASSVHTFTFQLPAGSDSPATSSNGILRTSMLSTTTAGDRSTIGNFPYMDPAFPRPSSTYLGPAAGTFAAGATAPEPNPVVTYHGVCLTVWSHADEDRSAAIRRTLETAARNRPGARSPKVSTMSMETDTGKGQRRRKKKTSPWSATEAEESEADFGESDIDGGLNVNTENPGASTLFLPPNTVFWLPYALSMLISGHVPSTLGSFYH
jgi:EEF1A N-terminal glycine/lysine methyltransferase